MSKTKFDIDIDVKPTTKKNRYGQPLGIYNEDQGTFTSHPSGILVDGELPIDPETGLVPIDHKDLSERGYVKVDLLSNHAYSRFKSKRDILTLLEMEDHIPWTKLFDRSFCDTLPHLKGNHIHVLDLEPRSIEDLADLIALIRPGKIHLMQDYKRDKERTRKNLYRKPANGKVYLKKSHAIAYATMIAVIMLNHEYPLAFFGGSRAR